MMCLLDKKKLGKVGELIVVERTKVLIYDIYCLKYQVGVEFCPCNCWLENNMGLFSVPGLLTCLLLQVVWSLVRKQRLYILYMTE